MYIYIKINMSLSGFFPFENWNFATQNIVNTLSEEDYLFLITKQSKQKYRKGDMLFREGIVPAGIYFIHEGKVKKYKEFLGKEQILYIANKGELVGYHAVLSEEKYPDSASCLENSIISFIPNEDFFTVLSRSATFSRGFLKVLSHEFTVFASNLFLHSRGTAEECLATALIVIREKSKNGSVEDKEVAIEISRGDLGDMAGVAPAHVSRILAEFKAAGIINISKKQITVTDLPKLIQRSGRTTSSE